MASNIEISIIILFWLCEIDGARDAHMYCIYIQFYFQVKYMHWLVLASDACIRSVCWFRARSDGLTHAAAYEASLVTPEDPTFLSKIQTCWRVARGPNTDHFTFEHNT
jgi:hypothetical protein